ncbi:cytochrome c oxidase subunit 6a, mitochondrial-like [Triticum aestivum]|uniref:cytochrome c oxidase subunit 6a, mitochondrial-like n=1 Tax=Triticum aestivum TaxID=4565 RepID=UPI001D023920|nr:cytochrome c oxidase subunit 6a, mitochondrial-like [Triticum aestivum]
MASLTARSGLRSMATRARPPATAPVGCRMSSSTHDDAYETSKWDKITIIEAVTCTLLAAWNLSKGHPHFNEPPAYPYLHIHN